MSVLEAPRDNLFRGLHGVPIESRAEGEGLATTLFGHFTKYDVWTEIDSWYEGRFLERFAAGSGKKTISENRDRIKCQFDHGYDPFVGSGVLGPIEVLRDEDEGPYYEVPLLDTDYNRDRVQPMLSGRLMNGATTGESVLGASHRFRVVKEEWVEPTKATEHNPERLPERTIREYSEYEFGPVVFPALLAATSGIRSVSLTDHYFERNLARSGRSARAAERLIKITDPAATGTGLGTTSDPPSAVDGPQTTSPARCRARLALAFADLS